MQVQTPQNQLTQLLHVNYDQIYNQLVARLSPRQMIFAKWRAGFGGIIQWDLPADVQWQRLSQADSFDYQSCMTLLENLSFQAKQSLGSNRAMIDAVYSVPSLDYVYFGRTPEGEYRIMLAGWGYRFPTTPAIDPLSYKRNATQAVDIYFRADGQPVASLPVELMRLSGHVGLTANDEGVLSIGNQEPGTIFNFNIPSYGRTFQITVEQGKQQYLVDLTIDKTVLEPHPPVPPVKPEIEEVNITIDSLHFRFINVDGAPVENATARFIQNGKEIAATGLLSGGEAIVEASAFQPGKVEVRLSSPIATFPTFNMNYEPAELDYEVYFHEQKRSNPWPVIIAALIAAAATLYCLFNLIVVW